MGLCCEDKVGRRAIRLCDLENADEFNNRVKALLSYHNAIRKGLYCLVVKKEEMLMEIVEIAKKILPYKKPEWKILNDLTREGKKIIFEGAKAHF